MSSTEQTVKEYLYDLIDVELGGLRERINQESRWTSQDWKKHGTVHTMRIIAQKNEESEKKLNLQHEGD